MVNLILILILALIVGAAIAYIYKAKKSGAKCIGCPDSKTCSSGCGCCSGCRNGGK
ncbi:MAG: FeoB-associated Cys-rich membrane protein [Clostridia bacterium]|nr:FeoB-associated Cys-rich membrane protein [Clostridia bacterium]